jgi:hypothetical protein
MLVPARNNPRTVYSVGRSAKKGIWVAMKNNVRPNSISKILRFMEMIKDFFFNVRASPT